MRERSKVSSEARSTLMGRIVDSYTNILTVKLFARARDEDDFVKEAIHEHTDAFRRQTRMVTAFGLTTAASYAWSGLISWELAGLFIAGGVVGGLIGTRSARHLAARRGACRSGQGAITPRSGARTAS